MKARSLTRLRNGKASGWSEVTPGGVNETVTTVSERVHFGEIVVTPGMGYRLCDAAV
jgi:hypothetical protein